ncbi:MAG: MMPL family transporter [Pirellulaceae bacterium]|nr:MMPL family transporter [Pirellulaceae bacterium]
MGWYKLIASRIVTRYWPFVIASWLVLAVTLRLVAPDWDSIAADGDLQFLPDDVPSAVGQRTMDSAFPGTQSRSQMMLVFANPSAKQAPGDLFFALDVARRLHWYSATNLLKNAELPAAPWNVEELSRRDSVLIETIQDNLNQAIEIDEELSRFAGSQNPPLEFARLPNTFALRGQLLENLGKLQEAADDTGVAKLMIEQSTPVIKLEQPPWAVHLRDVWTWRNPVIGHKLLSQDKHARLVAVQLGNDFTATSNIGILNGIEEVIRTVRAEHKVLVSEELQVQISGSAAFGADMLRAAASVVKKTEIVTILLVLGILALVYRGPFLIAIPLTSIALSLLVATAVIALLARDPLDATSRGIGVFTTTRIFVVVLLFGAGTDFCLFFLARNKELLQSRVVRTRRQMHQIVARGWRSTHNALVASAFTTIVGLALMWFSKFEKFQYNGPIIAISLAITMIVCLTFTPALLSALGRLAFWPMLKSRDERDKQSFLASGDWSWLWERIATWVVTYPRSFMLSAIALLAVPAAYGFLCLGWVTYDLTEELSQNATSRRGAKLISQYFPVQDGSPISIMLIRKTQFDSDESLQVACAEVSKQLYTAGVNSVRSLTDPLGDYPPDRKMGLLDSDAWRRRVLKSHRITRERYISTVDNLSQRLAKFDVILTDNPFSPQATTTLTLLRNLLTEETRREDSPWYGAEVVTAGTTVGITDLRSITQDDQTRIQILVTIGVWVVLIVLLRHLVLSTYLIFTVLLSYFSTLGITYWVFWTAHGADYNGLDWKVPLFLFVILVAVGQDYNVYLTTRILEEQRTLPRREGVRRALHLTGGIITSCGIVMAGTFVAMTSPAIIQWLSTVLPSGWIVDDAPVLRGITELGFALSFGVMLDTLIVRSILVPAFFVLWQNANGRITDVEPPAK